jgi:hypothetical protein
MKKCAIALQIKRQINERFEKSFASFVLCDPTLIFSIVQSAWPAAFLFD